MIYIYMHTQIYIHRYVFTWSDDWMRWIWRVERELFVSVAESWAPCEAKVFWLPQGLFHMDHSYIYILYYNIHIYMYIYIYVHILIHIIPYINTYILATPVRSSLHSGSQYSTMTWIRGEETSLYTGPVQLFPSLPMVQWIYYDLLA